MKRSMLVWLMVLPLAAAGQDLPKNELSISVGYMFEGEVYVWTPDVYGSVGESVLVKADYVTWFTDYFGLGGYVNYGSPYYWAFETVTMGEFGIVFKGRFQAGEDLLIKVPAYIGYRTYSNEAGQGLGINASMVLEYQLEGKVKPFLDVGFLAQPTGGNDATTMTFAPMFAACVGVSFAF